MLERFTSDKNPKKSIIDFLWEGVESYPRNQRPKIIMGHKDWVILRSMGPMDQLDIETSGPLIKAGIRGYIFGSAIYVEQRYDISFDPR